MIRKSIATVLIAGTVAAVGINSLIPKALAESQVQFICSQSFDTQTNRRLPTTFAWTPRGKIALVRWVKNLSDYSGQQRCEKVSPRFQEAYANGTLNWITNGKMNGQPVICTASSEGGPCQTLLMTLRPKDNSLAILIDFKDNLNGRASGPIRHSSGTPQVYYKIDIEEFLRNAPVEKE